MHGFNNDEHRKSNEHREQQKFTFAFGLYFHGFLVASCAGRKGYPTRCVSTIQNAKVELGTFGSDSSDSSNSSIGICADATNG